MERDRLPATRKSQISCSNISDSQVQIVPKVHNEQISIYKGSLSMRGVAKAQEMIRAAFPKLPAAWFDILMSRAKEKGFTDERLLDAVKHVIDTVPFSEPSPANFLSYDQKIEMLTYNELVTKANKEGFFDKAFDYYLSVEYGDGKFPMYVKREDFYKYNFKAFVPKKSLEDRVVTDSEAPTEGTDWLGEIKNTLKNMDINNKENK